MEILRTKAANQSFPMDMFCLQNWFRSRPVLDPFSKKYVLAEPLAIISMIPACGRQTKLKAISSWVWQSQYPGSGTVT